MICLRFPRVEREACGPGSSLHPRSPGSCASCSCRGRETREDQLCLGLHPPRPHAVGAGARLLGGGRCWSPAPVGLSPAPSFCGGELSAPRPSTLTLYLCGFPLRGLSH